MAGQQKNSFLPSLGMTIQNSRIHAAFISEHEECGILLYDRSDGSFLKKVSFRTKDRVGNVHFGSFPCRNPEQICYQLYDGSARFPDPFARSIQKRDYGTPVSEDRIFCMVPLDRFDWEGDRRPGLSYEDSIVYCMHVRGFTMHSSSMVKHPGTFQGLQEKLTYLKELGITTLELQPAYEFLEKEADEARLNYWGYKEGFYMAPKASYAASEDAVTEYKELIKSMHQLGMELIMQFYFPVEVSRRWIPEILRYWASEYHVDGFHLMGERLPVRELLEDPWLADCKLWTEEIPFGYGEADQEGRSGKADWNPHAALYDAQYRNDMRRFLRGEQDLLQTVCRQMRKRPAGYGVIHYLTNYDGLTMMDLVSYEDRHNEANGEFNEDGCRDNLSWNCGVEGPSGKLRIRKMRMQQYRNAMSLLMLSQGTPLFFMGDEFGNTQFGNNNPYCQDNEIAWLDWKQLEINRECYEFVKGLIDFRKAHPVLRQETEPRVMDYLALGCPDLSYHSEEAWRVAYRSLDRQIGMMYCGKYARIDRIREDNDLYLAINMHWEEKPLALPGASGDGYDWEPVFTTGSVFCEEEEQGTWAEAMQKEERNGEEGAVPEVIRMEPRTITVYISRKREDDGEGMAAF